jgi:hypothetical protein
LTNVYRAVFRNLKSGDNNKNASLYQKQISVVEKDLSEEQFVADVHKIIQIALSI